jgi:hypothetical protein
MAQFPHHLVLLAVELIPILDAVRTWLSEQQAQLLNLKKHHHRERREIRLTLVRHLHFFQQVSRDSRANNEFFHLGMSMLGSNYSPRLLGLIRYPPDSSMTGGRVPILLGAYP